MLKSAWTLARVLVTGWLWLCCSHTISAGPAGRYCVDVWGTREGLPQGSVISMVQTRDGYLWLGTLNGLVRFDGLHFTVYDESNTQGLNSSQIVKLFEDSQENLWVGTETAGAILVRAGQVLPLGIGRGSRDGRLMAACEDTNGSVWLATADGRIFRHRNGELREAVPDRAAFNSGSGYFPAVGNPVSDFLLASIHGGYWRIADGVIQKWADKKVAKSFGTYPWPKVKVSSACEDWQGNLVVGTAGSGVYWFDAEGKSTCLSTNDGLSSDYILSLHADDSHSLWVGTDGRGLNRVRPRLFETFAPADGLTVRSVCQSEGKLWFSSVGMGVTCVAGDVISTNRSIFGPMKDSDVRAMVADSKGRIWAATYSGALFLQGESFRPQDLVTAQSPVSALLEDRAGRIWAGSKNGLWLWDEKSWRCFTTKDGLSANIVRALADDGHGSLWIGTELGGLNRLKDGVFSNFQQTNSFPSDNISALYADADGVLWVGTFGCGLVRVQDDKWTRYTTREGLVSNGINYLAEDTSGCLWIGSNRGLMRIRKKALNEFARGECDFVPCAAFGERDGLPASECTLGAQPAAYQSPDGKLWFPTTAGLASANPAEFTLNTNPPPVRIESVRLGNRRENTDGIRSEALKSITIPAGSERLEIQFAAISLTAPNALRFKCQLQGHENPWTAASDNRVARYIKLPPGQYTFNVTACNEDGFWNPTGASLAVIVLPPFWSTWWFRSATGAGLLGFISITIYLVSTKRLQRQLERMRQHEALEKERARIARDIHDQVGASLTQVSLLGEMVESDKDYPDEVEAHGKQISQTARETARALDEIVWTVNPSNDTLEGLVNYICKNAQDYLTIAGLRYRFEVPAQLPSAEITPEARHNVFLAAKEAVTNVVKHAKASEVSIRLKLDKEKFTLEIQDNGRGPSGSADPAKQTRNGLRNMHKRMEDIGGTFSLEPASDGGTIARLTAPMTLNQE